MKMDGGVDAVRVVPIRMQNGGDAAEKLLAEGPPEGPKQFKMPDERMITKRRQIEILFQYLFQMHKNLFLVNLKHNLISTSQGQDIEWKSFLFTTPTINPLEALPVLPFMPEPSYTKSSKPFYRWIF